MTARVLRPVITLTTVMAIIATAVAAYAFMTAGTANADSTYDPLTTVKYCNAMPPVFGSTDPTLVGSTSCSDVLGAGSHPDFTTQLKHISGDLNFSSVVTLAPTSQTIAGGGSMPVGTKIGGLHSATTLGTFNNPCFTSLDVDFVFYNVALPNDLGDPRASTNIVFPRPQGSPNRFDGWQVGSEPPAAGGTAPVDAGPGVATPTSMPIVNYPSYLLNIFDPDFVPGGAGNGNDSDGPIDPLVPNAVYGGLTSVVGQWIPLFFAQFNANALTPMGGALGSFGPNMGQPSVSVLNDPSAVKASPSSITDFCTALEVTTMLLGVPSGNNRLTQPGAATTQFTVQYNASLRDTDQDGYENAIDTCPVDVSAGNPRAAIGTGDADTDGIDDSCDTASTPGIGDVDADAFQNRQDNCPQVNNGNPTATPIPAAGVANQLEDEYPIDPADDGPRIDSIGNACDNEEGSVTVTQNCTTLCPGANQISITMSDTVANGRYMTLTNAVAKCVAGTDADADGYCSGNDSTDNPGGVCAPHCAARHTAWSGATHPLLQMDTDGDLWSDAQETYLSRCDDSLNTPCVTPNAFGTDATKPCVQSTTGNNEGPLDNWPYDFDDNGQVTGPDILKYGTPFGRTVNSGTASVSGMGTTVPIYRFDLTFDGIVSGPDILKFGTVFGLKCGTVGTLGIPNWSQQ